MIISIIIKPEDSNYLYNEFIGHVKWRKHFIEIDSSRNVEH